MSVQAAETAASSAVAATAKVAPPIAVTGMQFAGYAVADWVMLLTLIYTVIQLGLLIWDRYKKFNAKKRDSKALPEAKKK